MGIKIKHPFLNARKQLTKRHVSRKPGSQDMGVKQKAYHRLQFLPVAVGKRNSQRDVFASRVAIEEGVQRRGKDRE